VLDGLRSAGDATGNTAAASDRGGSGDVYAGAQRDGFEHRDGERGAERDRNGFANSNATGRHHTPASLNRASRDDGYTAISPE
jgi:hypothetical protein